MRRTLVLLIELACLSTIGYGIWLIHPPTCWIVMGAIILAIAVLEEMSLNSNNKKRKTNQ